MRRIRYYLIITVVLVIGTITCLLMENRTVSIRKGYTEPVIPASWKELIYANGASQIIPDIYVGSKKVEIKKSAPYIIDDLDVMIPADMLQESLGVLILKTEAGQVTVIYGEHRADVNLETDMVTLDGEAEVMANAASERNGVCYVSSGFLSKKMGLTAAFDETQTVLRFEEPEFDDDYLPAYFTLSGINRQPEVQDQLDLGTCWAFASLSALESHLLPGASYSFSRDHMVLKNSFSLPENGSGETSMAQAYFLAWQGPAADVNDVYGDGVVSDNLETLVHVQDTVMMDDPSIDELKHAVMMHGGVEASMYLAMADTENLLYVDHYYNSDSCAYYYNGDASINHDVVIVGWDDYYSVSHFVKGDELPGNGAFICMNSWGTEFGLNGLFYVSYYDTRFASSCMYYTNVESANNYSNIYQSDLCGVTANAGYGSDTAYFANIYTAESDELLAACGFYTLGKNSSYQVYGISKVEDELSLKNAKLLAEGKLSQKGFHTIRFAERLELTAGEDFSIIVKLSTPGLEYPVAVEKVTDSIINVDITDGRGYISSNGLYFKSSERDSASNVCLKAYTILRQ